MADTGKGEIRRQIQLTLRSIKGITTEGDKQLLSLVDQLRRNIIVMLVENGRIDANLLRSLREQLPEIMRRFDTEFSGLLSENQRRVFVKGIQMVDRVVKASGTLAAVPYLDETVLKQVAEFDADLIRNVSDTARRNIATEVSLAVMGQKSVDDVMDSIGRNLTSPSVFKSVRDRARAIYITEMHRVQNAATAQRLKQLQKQVTDLDKEWLHSHRGLPRFNHLAMDGTRVPANENFTLVGKNKQTYSVAAPHDPTLPASETVNCRCTIIPVVRRFQTPPKPVPPPAPQPKPPSIYDYAPPPPKVPQVPKVVKPRKVRKGPVREIETTIDTTNMDKELLRDVEQALADVTKLLPGCVPRSVAVTKFPPRSTAYAHCVNTKTIELREKYFKPEAWSLIETMYARDVRTGFHPKLEQNHSPRKAIVAHEVAHTGYLDWVYWPTYNSGGVPKVEEARRRLLHDMRSMFRTHKKQVTAGTLPANEFISRYALDNSDEFMAESVTNVLYAPPDKVSPTAKAVVARLQQYGREAGYPPTKLTVKKRSSV